MFNFLKHPSDLSLGFLMMICFCNAVPIPDDGDFEVIVEHASKDRYKEAAKSKFEDLINHAFPMCDEYWMLGHSFDTMLDHVSSYPDDTNGTLLFDVAMQQFHATRGYW
jgi:hypothetical protein